VLPPLTPERFSADKVHKVAQFDCGAAHEWEVYLNEWIKGPEALKSMTDWNTEIWLYYTGNQLVGYGSFGPNRLIWPYNTSLKQQVTIIPAFAVSGAFRRKPDGVNRHDRFAWRILSDLVCRSLLHGTDMLMLYVHKDNSFAQRFYGNFGFANAGISRVADHNLMLFDLRELRLRIAAPAPMQLVAPEKPRTEADPGVSSSS